MAPRSPVWSQSYFSSLHLFRKVFRGAPRERHNPSGDAVCPWQGHKAAAIGYEKVLDVVRLAELMERGCLRVIAHPRRAAFVRRVAHWLDKFPKGEDLCSARAQNLLHPSVHIRHHLPVV